jgi:hypothetical protein
VGLNDNEEDEARDSNRGRILRFSEDRRWRRLKGMKSSNGYLTGYLMYQIIKVEAFPWYPTYPTPFWVFGSAPALFLR